MGWNATLVVLVQRIFWHLRVPQNRLSLLLVGNN